LEVEERVSVGRVTPWRCTCICIHVGRSLTHTPISSNSHCPNLVPSDEDRKRFPELRNLSAVPVKVIFDAEQKFYWDSLVHLWNDWYLRYLNADYPRLIVRFEDTLIHAPKILEMIANCTGVTVAETLSYQTNKAKGHGSGSNFLSAIIKTGNETKRVTTMTPEDLTFAKNKLDKTLMRLFQYRHPKASTLQKPGR
jgi:hypothetical protein